MQTLGIIGAGNSGSAIARLAVAAGIPVIISNSRDPESLAGIINELGPLATAGTIEQSAEAGDIVVLSIPLTAATDLSPELLKGKVVLDTSNYYPFRDGRIEELDENQITTSERSQRHFSSANIVKAFNNILAHHIPLLARPSGAADRTSLPIAGDDDQAKRAVAALIDQLGFDAFDAGPLAESWRFEPEANAYTQIYLADQTTPPEEMLQAAAAPVSIDTLRNILNGSTRVRVANRMF